MSGLNGRGGCRWRVEREQQEREIDALTEAEEGREEEHRLLKEENEQLKVCGGQPGGQPGG